MTARVYTLPMSPRHAFSRSQRRWWSMLQIVALLFMQLAISAYVCPMAQAHSVAAGADGDLSDMSDMPGCHGKSGDRKSVV